MGVGECVSARVCIVVCGHVFVCLVRSVYLDADDTILMAVEVCGDTLLSWSEGMLATPPFFYQMSGMAVGRNPDNVQGCRINELQVHTHLVHAPTRILQASAGLVSPS